MQELTENIPLKLWKYQINPLQLIQQATVNAANLFNMQNEIGQVKEGFLADLIVLDGNPLENISLLTSPDKHLKLVIKGGEVYIQR